MKSTLQQNPLSRVTSVVRGQGICASSEAHVNRRRDSALEQSPGHSGIECWQKQGWMCWQTQGWMCSKHLSFFKEDVRLLKSPLEILINISVW